MSYQQQFHRWLHSDALSPEEKAQLQAIADDPKEVEDRFFGLLEFGTAGLRGVMGLGLRRMNVHVIRHATQAFAQVILAEGPAAAAQGVAICYDCRVHSQEFARAAAGVMAANGIPVRLFEAMRPTPELSFAVREYGCVAGLNVTASTIPGDVRTMDYEQARAQGLITLLGRETDDKFLSHVLDQINDRQAVAQVTDAFRMVYTPFHGTGYQQIPYVLEQLGIRYLHCVPEQMVIDGTFPTVKSPNPETPESFALAQKLAKEVDAQLILGSDPDADRVAIQVKDRKGDYVQLSGNQTGVLLLDYLIGAKRRAGTLPENPVALKSLVTTQLAQVVAEANGVRCYNTFTGFKFMAEKKNQLEAAGQGHVIFSYEESIGYMISSRRFRALKKNQLEAAGQGHVIFSYEESIGYMIGDYVRDKDAVTAALLLTEMTAWYAARGMTLLDALQAIYETYGYYGENTLNLVMPGLEGMGKMQAIMAALRQTPPDQIAGTTVCLQRDYQTGTERDTATGETTAMELAGSNVLGYQLADGTTLVVRPSGTEPKIKVYVLASGTDSADCQRKVEQYTAWAETLRHWAD